MKRFLITIYIVLGLVLSCIEPIHSQNRCVHCNMDIEAPKFQAKADLNNGTSVYFDAIECLVNHLKGKKEKNFQSLWVTDYDSGKYISATTAYYLKSKSLPSPMGANLSAYATSDLARKKLGKLGGAVFNWDELRERFVNSNFGQSQGHHHHHGVHTYAPVGISGDHLHPKGGLMLSVKYMYMKMDGNREGRQRVNDDTVYDSYMVSPQQMGMDMLMIGAMYAPSDKLTLMLMQNFMWKNMDLTANMMMGNGMTMLRDFSTGSNFLGDLKLSALFGLYSGEKTSFHLNSMVNFPTGDIDNRDATPMMPSAKLPYAMQLGTGTFDFTIGATFKGSGRHWSYGIQQLNTFRTGENSEGYRFGNLYELHSWVSYGISDAFGASLRLSGLAESELKGMDPELNPMMVTTADTDNYGGELIRSGLGINTRLFGSKFLLGTEFVIPLYRNYNGIQMDEKWGINASLRYIAI